MTHKRPVTSVHAPEVSRALSWRDMLLVFDDDSAAALVPFCQRIEALIGPRMRPRQQGAGEPDGVDGVTRRGSYERLLISEWAIGEAAPDEFLRRAASGEHAFFSLARQDPEGSQKVAVYFDAGPSQIGPPRLCHLAALLVLASRAATSGAAFSWQVLQGTAAPLDRVDRFALSRLLQARSPSLVTPDDVEHALSSEVDEADVESADIERWWVGGEHVRGFRAQSGAKEDSLLVVAEEVAMSGEASLDVTIARGAQATRSVSFPRPAADVCDRLLRDPFRPRPANITIPTSRIDAARGVVFAASGRRVVVQAKSGRVVAYVVPNSPNEKPGKSKELYADLNGMQPYAAGVYKRRPFAVAVGEGELRMFGLGEVGGTGLPLPAPDSFAGELPATLQWAGVMRTESGISISCRSPSHRALLLPLRYGPIEIDSLERHRGIVRDLVLRGSRVSFTTWNPAERAIEVWVDDATDDSLPALEVSMHVRGDGPPVATSLGGTSMGHYAYGVCTVAEAQGAPQFVGVGGGHEFGGSGVVGGLFSEQSKGPAALKLDADRLRFTTHDGTTSISTPQLPAPVLHFAISPTAAAVAYVTTAGDLGVYSFDYRATLLDVRDVDLQ